MPKKKPPKEPEQPAASSVKQFPDVMTVEQLAEYLQMNPQVVYRHVRRNLIPASRIGKVIRFHKKVIDQWLADLAQQRIRLPEPTEQTDLPPRTRRKFDAEVD